MYKLPPKKGMTRAPLAAASEITAKNPDKVMDTINEIAVPVSGISHSKLSRLILPPSKGHMGSRFNMGQAKFTNLSCKKRMKTVGEISPSLATSTQNSTSHTAPYKRN